MPMQPSPSELTTRPCPSVRVCTSTPFPQRPLDYCSDGRRSKALPGNDEPLPPTPGSAPGDRPRPTTVTIDPRRSQHVRSFEPEIEFECDRDVRRRHDRVRHRPAGDPLLLLPVQYQERPLHADQGPPTHRDQEPMVRQVALLENGQPAVLGQPRQQATEQEGWPVSYTHLRAHET